MGSDRLIRLYTLMSYAALAIALVSLALSAAACRLLGRRLYCLMIVVWLAAAAYAARSAREARRLREAVVSLGPPGGEA